MAASAARTQRAEAGVVGRSAQPAERRSVARHRGKKVGRPKKRSHAMNPTTTAPATRRRSDHVYYSMTKSLCGVCKRAVDAKIVFRDGEVWFDKFCPGHGRQEV